MNFEFRTLNKERRMNSPLHLSKRLLLPTAVLLIAGYSAAQETKPAGTAAQLTVATGKTISVRLLKMEDNKVTFKAGSKEMTVPANKISSFNFALNKEEFEFFTGQKIITDEQVKEIFGHSELSKREKLGMIFEQILQNIEDDFNQGNYTKVISSISPFMTERAPYMQVENNLQNTFVILIDSYRALGDFSKVRSLTAPLLESNDAHLVLKAQVNNAQAAIAAGDFQTAEKIHGEIENEVAALYLEALIKRAQGDPKAAIQIVTTIISEHANNVEWTAPSELLSAYLYMDMISTNGVGLSTNSVINTARQVKNIYGGTAVAADARKLWASLGGEAIEAKEQALKAKQKQQREEREAKEAELAAAQAAQEAAAKAAAEAAAATNHVDVTTSEIESE